MSWPAKQTGASLIEVLVSLLVLGIGLLGAAALQLNALKFTDSSTLSSQASFLAYDMMDRIRANPNANYALSALSAAPTSAGGSTRNQDLVDFAANVTALGGADAATSSIDVKGRLVTITIRWSDARAAGASNVSNVAGTDAAVQEYKLVSRVAMDKDIK